MSTTTKVAAATIAALAVVGTATGVVVSQEPGPSPGTCQSLPADQINAEPPGATWNGGGGCYTTDGLTVTASNITIADATLEDPLTAKPGKPVHGFPPIVELLDTNGVVLSDLTIDGADPSGTYHASLVGEAGIKLVQTAGTTISDVTVDGSFGDCLEVFAIPPHQAIPNTGLTVSTFTADNCGRMNMTLADVYGAQITDFTGGNYGYASLDFESDVATGAGQVVISDSTWGGTIFEENITGPITFDHDHHGRVTGYGKKPPAVAYPITFEDGSLNIASKANPPGIWIPGYRSLTFSGYTFTRSAVAGAQKAKLWGVGNGQLTITGSVLSPPLGATGASATLSGDT